MERSTQQIQRLKEERAENEAKIEQLTHQNERLKAREQYLAGKNGMDAHTGSASQAVSWKAFCRRSGH